MSYRIFLGHKRIKWVPYAIGWQQDPGDLNILLNNAPAGHKEILCHTQVSKYGNTSSFPDWHGNWQQYHVLYHVCARFIFKPYDTGRRTARY